MQKKIWQFGFLAFLIWLLSQSFLRWPDFFFVAVSLSVLLIILAVLKTISRYGKAFWPRLALSPVLFYLSAVFFSSILINNFWIQFIFAACSFFIFVYFKNIYYHLAFGAPEREAKLRKLILSASFLSFFASASALYALPIFLNLSFWLIFLFLILLSFSFFFQMLTFIGDRKNKEEILFLTINSLVLSEAAGALLLLPLSFNVRGLLLSLVFYSLVLFNNWRREKRLNVKNLKWSLTIGIFLILLILLSARWL